MPGPQESEQLQLLWPRVTVSLSCQANETLTSESDLVRDIAQRVHENDFSQDCATTFVRKGEEEEGGSLHSEHSQVI